MRMGAPRIWLRALTTGYNDGVVEEAVVHLTAHGEGDGLAPGLDAEAALVFGAGFLQRARQLDPLEYEEFARLEGRVVVDEQGVRFQIPEEATFSYSTESTAEANTAQPPRWTLKLEYDGVSFPGAEAATSARELSLPADPPGARFAEISAVLEVAGRALVALGTAGILDVALEPINGACNILVRPVSKDEVPATLELELISTDEVVQRKRSLSDADADADGVFVVPFEKLDRRRRYSLFCTAAEAERTLIFEDVAYSQLAVLGQQEPVELPGEDEPSQETRDPMLSLKALSRGDTA